MKSMKTVPTVISSASSYFRDAASRLGFKGSLEVSVTATRVPKVTSVVERPPTAVQTAVKVSSVSVHPPSGLIPQSGTSIQEVPTTGTSTQEVPTTESSKKVTSTSDIDQRNDNVDNFEAAMTDWMKRDEEEGTIVRARVGQEAKTREVTDTDSILSPCGESDRGGETVVSEGTVKRDGRLTRSAVHARARSLLRILSSPTLTLMNQRIRVHELMNHLISYPDACGTCVKTGAISILLRLRERSEDPSLSASARQVLSLLGYSDPPRGQGIRILSIDGGGIRGVVILELLTKLQSLTGQPVHQMFDLICGVSTGAILTMLIGALKADIQTCHTHYRMVSKNLFVSDFWRGTHRLITTHAYYDARKWEAILKQVYGEDR